MNLVSKENGGNLVVGETFRGKANLAKRLHATTLRQGLFEHAQGLARKGADRIQRIEDAVILRTKGEYAIGKLLYLEEMHGVRVGLVDVIEATPMAPPLAICVPDVPMLFFSINPLFGDDKSAACYLELLGGKEFCYGRENTPHVLPQAIRRDQMETQALMRLCNDTEAGLIELYLAYHNFARFMHTLPDQSERGLATGFIEAHLRYQLAISLFMCHDRARSGKDREDQAELMEEATAAAMLLSHPNFTVAKIIDHEWAVDDGSLIDGEVGFVKRLFQGLKNPEMFKMPSSDMVLFSLEFLTGCLGRNEAGDRLWNMEHQIREISNVIFRDSGTG